MKSLTILLLTALLFCACKKNPVTHNDKTEPDSTTHNIAWKKETMGQYSSFIKGIWGNRPNNVYAVGYIYTYVPGDYGTCLLHYDGAAWKRIELIAEMATVFGFDDSTIWLGGTNGNAVAPKGAIYKYNGKQFTKYDLKMYPFIIKIWGTSPKNIYAIGGSGSILHFDGHTWSPQSSKTNLTLTDIWGTSANDIYIVGGNSDTGMGVLLHFDGLVWNKLYERKSGGSEIPAGYSGAIWGFDEKNILFSTGSNSFGMIYQGFEGNWKAVFSPVDYVLQQDIHGTSSKNYYIIGDFGMIIHWNGKNWRRYEEFYRQENSDDLYCCWAFENEVFIGGAASDQSTSMIYHGTMK